MRCYQERQESTYMAIVDKKYLKKFYEREASRVNHQELMYVKGNKHKVWWHRKRFKCIISFLAEIFKERQVITFADMGCGEGYYIKRVISIYNGMFCIGVDLARTYIEKAKKNMKKFNVDFVVCDVENLPFRGHCFDTVLCSEVLEHVLNHHKALSELYRVTKKYLVLSFPGHSYIYKIVNKAEFFRKLINSIMPKVGHISEVTMDSVERLTKTYGNKTSMEVKIGGALPLQLYEIIPSIKLVNVIDNVICKILRCLKAVEYATIHVVKIERKGII